MKREYTVYQTDSPGLAHQESPCLVSTCQPESMFQLRLVLLFVFGVVFKTQAKEASQQMSTGLQICGELLAQSNGEIF